MQGIVQRAVVGNDGICHCQIQRTALCFHLAQCVHAGRKRPAAAHGQCIHRPVDEQNDTVLVQSTQILRLFYNAAAAGNELSALFAKALCFGSFLCAEAVLALGCKDIRDAAAVGLYDLLVEVHKGAAKALCQQPAEGGLAGRGHPD